MRKILTWLLLSLCAAQALAQQPTVPGTMQQARGNPAHIPTLKDGQLFLGYTATADVYTEWFVGTATHGNQGPFSLLNVSSANGLSNAVSFLAGPHLTIVTSSPNITYDLALTGVTAGTYGDGTHVPQLAINNVGEVTGASNVAISFPVTSVTASGGTTGLTFSGGTTGAVTQTLGGTLGIPNGGSGQTTANNALNAFLPSQSGNSGKYLTTNGTNSSWGTVAAGTGTVTSVAASGGTTGLTFTGSPITTSGTFTIGGTLATANGGTGTTAGAEPPLGNPTVNGQALVSTTGGTRSWYTIPAGGTGTVTSAALSLPAGVFSISGSPVTTTGTLTGSFVTQSANTFFRGPNSGSAATPGFGPIVVADIPGLPTTAITSGVFGASFLGTGTANSTTYLRGDGTWQVPSFTTTLAGDVTGPSGSNTVKLVENMKVDGTIPPTGYVWMYMGSSVGWYPSTPAGDVSGLFNAEVVDHLRGIPISSGTPADGSMITYSNSAGAYVFTVPANFATNESLGTGTTTGLNQVFTLAHTPISGSVMLYVDSSGTESYALLNVYSGNFTVTGTSLSIATTLFVTASWTPGTTKFYASYRY